MSTTPRDVIVTGGTGALGRALVAAFLAAGDRVVVPWIVKRESDALAEFHAGALRDARLALLEADVADEAAARAVVDVAGSVDVLVNGVGGFEGGSPLHETPLETWDRMYRINLRSAVSASRAVLPGMCRRGRGVIVSVSSRAAFERPAGLAAYAASKLGVVLLTETLQKEAAAHGVRVLAVAPATIDTPANRAAMPDADFASWTAPDAIARVILWLTGDDAAPLRGSVIPV